MNFFIFLVCLLQRIYVFNLHNTSPQLGLCCREFWIICRRPAGHEKMGWHRWSESVLILGGFPGGTSGKEPTPVNAGDIRDASSILGSGRSPGGGHGNPLEYSCLENPKVRGAWQPTVHRVPKNWTWLKQLSTHVQSCFCKTINLLLLVNCKGLSSKSCAPQWQYTDSRRPKVTFDLWQPLK